MTVRTRAQLLSDADTNLADNTAQAIGAGDVRDQDKNTADSVLMPEDRLLGRRVRAATTANITIATALNNADSLDGVTLATGDLVLVKDQSAPAENGIYEVAASPGRHTQFAAYDDHPGILISVEEGTTNADTFWLCTSNRGGTIAVTAIAFARAPAAIATAAEWRTGTNTSKAVGVSEAWNAAAEVTLTDAATIAVDFSTFINGVVTLAGNRALGNPTNEKVGQSGYIRIVQDGTGSRTLSYGSDWEFAGGTAPVLSTTAADQDLLFYQVIAADRVFASLVKDIS